MEPPCSNGLFQSSLPASHGPAVLVMPIFQVWTLSPERSNSTQRLGEGADLAQVVWLCSLVFVSCYYTEIPEAGCL